MRAWVGRITDHRTACRAQVHAAARVVAQHVGRRCAQPECPEWVPATRPLGLSCGRLGLPAAQAAPRAHVRWCTDASGPVGEWPVSTPGPSVAGQLRVHGTGGDPAQCRIADIAVGQGTVEMARHHRAGASAPTTASASRIVWSDNPTVDGGKQSVRCQRTRCCRSAPRRCGAMRSAEPRPRARPRSRFRLWDGAATSRRARAARNAALADGMTQARFRSSAAAGVEPETDGGASRRSVSERRSSALTWWSRRCSATAVASPAIPAPMTTIRAM